MSKKGNTEIISTSCTKEVLLILQSAFNNIFNKGKSEESIENYIQVFLAESYEVYTWFLANLTEDIIDSVELFT